MSDVGAVKGVALETDAGIDVTVDIGPLLRATSLLHQALVPAVLAAKDEDLDKQRLVGELRDVVDGQHS